MIDPYNLQIPIHIEQRQDFILWCCTVQGKNAGVQAKKCNEMFEEWRCKHNTDLFKVVRSMPKAWLLEQLKKHRMGQYGRIAAMWEEIAWFIDMSIVRLLSVPYIGPKTAHFIMLYLTGGEYPVLDRHVLRWMSKALGGANKAPTKTPTSINAYNEWATIFLQLAKERGMTCAQLDKVIWNEGAGERRQVLKMD